MKLPAATRYCPKCTLLYLHTLSLIVSSFTHKCSIKVYFEHLLCIAAKILRRWISLITVKKIYQLEKNAAINLVIIKEISRSYNMQVCTWYK